MVSEQGVVIIGAGVLGAAIGWALSGRGVEVTLFDPQPGGVASPGSFAWLNASFAQHPVYNALRRDSLARWKQLAEADPSVPVAFNGSLVWEQEHFDLDALLTSQRQLDLPATLVGPSEIGGLCSSVRHRPERALHLQGDGHGDPEAITTWFLDGVKGNGAIVEPAGVDEVVVDGGRVVGVRTGGDDVEARQVIVAAGVGLPRLLTSIGLDLAMENEAGLLARTTPGRAAFDTVLIAPDVHVWQRTDGGYLIGADFGGSLHIDDPDGTSTRVLASLGDLLDGTDGCTVEHVTVRERPKPVDGLPAIGPFGPDGLYVVSTHSGMTLAPVIAEMVTTEIAEGRVDPRLGPFRPDRSSLGPRGG